MADIMDTPLDEKVVQQLLSQVLLHKLTSQMQNEDPLRQAQVAHMQAQTQGLKDANDPSKLIALLTGQGGDTAAAAPNPAAPMAGATAFLPNGSYVSGSAGPGQAPGYTPPTEYNLDSNPYSAGMGSLTRTNPTAAPGNDVLIRGKNPATGNPWFGNQLPEWASPEARAQLATDQANNGATGKANAGAASAPGLPAGVSPQEMAKMMTISAAFDKHGMPAEVKNNALQQMFPWIGQQKEADLKQKKQTEADIRKASAPAPGGTYLDEQGQQYNPIYGGDIQPKTTLYRANSPQEKIFGATGLLNGHVDATISQLSGIASGDRNRFAQLLKTKMSVLENNPETNTLVNFLEPATALALGSLYSAGGSRIQGGAKLAQMFKGGVYSPGDTLATTLNNLKAIETLALGTAQHSNMHPALIGEIQQRLDQIDALQKSPSTGKAGNTNSPNQPSQPKWETSGGIRYYRD